MIIYEILTFLIMLLARVRYRYLKKFYWKTRFYVRKDRHFSMSYGSNRTFELKCCDCGLVHSIENHYDDWYPIRPKHYKYLLRLS